jgi:hypothetical protein
MTEKEITPYIMLVASLTSWNIPAVEIDLGFGFKRGW